MTLREATDGPPTRKEGFVIFYASRDENQTMWCPDCRVVEADVEKAFERVDGTVVYVGGRSEWKKRENVYRQSPWRVDGVPTIIRMNEEGEELGRLAEEEIREEGRLRTFVGSAA